MPLPTSCPCLLDMDCMLQTEYYRNFVFGGNRVKRRGFIEDKLGNSMLDNFRIHGCKAHAEYGTWIFDDLSSEPMVSHVHGRGFLLEEERQQRILKGERSPEDEQPGNTSSSRTTRQLAITARAAPRTHLGQN
jgi:hypothetical protein